MNSKHNLIAILIPIWEWERESIEVDNGLRDSTELGLIHRESEGESVGVDNVLVYGRVLKFTLEGF